VRLPWLSKVQYLFTGKSALRDLMVKAEDGDALSQHLLAGIYYSRKDVPTEMEQAIYWWRKSAEQGFADAQFNLAVMHLEGCGVERNEKEALRWLLLAAKQGKAEAQCLLGTWLLDDNNVEVDVQQAVWWLWLAADQAYRDAQYYLGLIYLEGKLAPDRVASAEHLVRAHVWLGLASRSGHADAIKACETAASHMTPEAVVEAQRLAQEWSPRTRMQSALEVFQAEVEEFFQSLNAGPSEASAKDVNEFLDRADDLIDTGVSLGETADNLVKTLRDVRRALAIELETAVPEIKDSLARITALKEVLRAPALRPWLKRPN
jgi:hypothetical protein